LVCATVKDAAANADVGGMTTSKRMSSNDMALIGVVLLALGIAVLATGAGLLETATVTAGLWTSAALTFASARHPGRRR
jgi:hypothetical protein